MPVRHERRRNAGVFTIDTPPVNVISTAVREGLMRHGRSGAYISHRADRCGDWPSSRAFDAVLPDMSGARIAGTAALELSRIGGGTALATMCVGVGQGAALLIERA